MEACEIIHQYTKYFINNTSLKFRPQNFCDSLFVYSQPQQLLISHWTELEFVLNIQDTLRIICNIY